MCGDNCANAPKSARACGKLRDIAKIRFRSYENSARPALAICASAWGMCAGVRNGCAQVRGTSMACANSAPLVVGILNNADQSDVRRYGHHGKIDDRSPNYNIKMVTGNSGKILRARCIHKLSYRAETCLFSQKYISSYEYSTIKPVNLILCRIAVTLNRVAQCPYKGYRCAI